MNALEVLKEIKELDYELWIKTNGYSHLSEEQWCWLLEVYPKVAKDEYIDSIGLK